MVGIFGSQGLHCIYGETPQGCPLFRGFKCTLVMVIWFATRVYTHYEEVGCSLFRGVHSGGPLYVTNTFLTCLATTRSDGIGNLMTILETGSIKCHTPFHEYSLLE